MSRSRWIRVVLVGVAVAGAVVAYRQWPRDPSPTSLMRRSSARLEVASIPAGPRPPEAPVHPDTDRERLMAAAHGMRGIPYLWGAKGPDRLDCSGFTKAAYAKVGVALPDGSFNQARGEQAFTSVSQLAPGDLIFYRWSGADTVSHVTLYAGDGWAIGTGSPGQLGEVVVYELADDLSRPGTVLTFRHVRLDDEDR